jgi:hypothetical protein
MLHAWHVPQLEAPQHTPSTQKLPVRHSSVDAQAWPTRFLLPHRFVLRSQMAGAVQLASEVHVVAHVMPLQANGAHGSVLAARHVPAPSHVRASVAVDPPAGQVGAAHTVPAAYTWQAPAPSHAPVCPQLAAPWSLHVPVGSAAPDATGAQVPRADVSAQDMQVPAQAVRQQTPCAQKPVAHSVPSPQLAPADLRPHEPPTHTEGVWQSASAVHVPLHAAAPHL